MDVVEPVGYYEGIDWPVARVETDGDPRFPPRARCPSHPRLPLTRGQCGCFSMGRCQSQFFVLPIFWALARITLFLLCLLFVGVEWFVVRLAWCSVGQGVELTVHAEVAGEMLSLAECRYMMYSRSGP